MPTVTNLNTCAYNLRAISVIQTISFWVLLMVCADMAQAAPFHGPVVKDANVSVAGEPFSEPLSTFAAINLQREARVLHLLRGFEWQLDVEGFSALPDNCWEDLLRIANDRRFMKVTRSRASAALTLFSNDSVWSHMLSQLGGDHHSRKEDVTSEDAVMRRRAADQMCQTFAVARPEAVEGNMISLLNEVDPQLRVRAARCLKLMTTETASEALLEYKTKLQHSAAGSQWELEALGLQDLGL